MDHFDDDSLILGPAAVRIIRQVRDRYRLNLKASRLLAEELRSAQLHLLDLQCKLKDLDDRIYTLAHDGNSVITKHSSLRDLIHQRGDLAAEHEQLEAQIATIRQRDGAEHVDLSVAERKVLRALRYLRASGALLLHRAADENGSRTRSHVPTRRRVRLLRDMCAVSALGSVDRVIKAVEACSSYTNLLSEKSSAAEDARALATRLQHRLALRRKGVQGVHGVVRGGPEEELLVRQLEQAQCAVATASSQLAEIGGPPMLPSRDDLVVLHGVARAAAIACGVPLESLQTRTVYQPRGNVSGRVAEVPVYVAGVSGQGDGGVGTGHADDSVVKPVVCFDDAVAEVSYALAIRCLREGMSSATHYIHAALAADVDAALVAADLAHSTLASTSPDSDVHHDAARTATAAALRVTELQAQRVFIESRLASMRAAVPSLSRQSRRTLRRLDAATLRASSHCSLDEVSFVLGQASEEGGVERAQAHAAALSRLRASLVAYEAACTTAVEAATASCVVEVVNSLDSETRAVAAACDAAKAELDEVAQLSILLQRSFEDAKRSVGDCNVVEGVELAATKRAAAEASMSRAATALLDARVDCSERLAAAVAAGKRLGVLKGAVKNAVDTLGGQAPWLSKMVSTRLGGKRGGNASVGGDGEGGGVNGGVEGAAGGGECAAECAEGAQGGGVRGLEGSEAQKPSVEDLSSAHPTTSSPAVDGSSIPLPSSPIRNPSPPSTSAAPPRGGPDHALQSFFPQDAVRGGSAGDVGGASGDGGAISRGGPPVEQNTKDGVTLTVADRGVEGSRSTCNTPPPPAALAAARGVVGSAGWGCDDDAVCVVEAATASLGVLVGLEEIAFYSRKGRGGAGAVGGSSVAANPTAADESSASTQPHGSSTPPPTASQAFEEAASFSTRERGTGSSLEGLSRSPRKDVWSVVRQTPSAASVRDAFPPTLFEKVMTFVGLPSRSGGGGGEEGESAGLQKKATKTAGGPQFAPICVSESETASDDDGGAVVKEGRRTARFRKLRDLLVAAYGSVGKATEALREGSIVSGDTTGVLASRGGGVKDGVGDDGSSRRGRGVGSEREGGEEAVEGGAHGGAGDGEGGATSLSFDDTLSEWSDGEVDELVVQLPPPYVAPLVAAVSPMVALEMAGDVAAAALAAEAAAAADSAALAAAEEAVEVSVLSHSRGAEDRGGEGSVEVVGDGDGADGDHEGAVAAVGSEAQRAAPPSDARTGVVRSLHEQRATAALHAVGEYLAVVGGASGGAAARALHGTVAARGGGYIPEGSGRAVGTDVGNGVGGRVDGTVGGGVSAQGGGGGETKAITNVTTVGVSSDTSRNGGGVAAGQPLWSQSSADAVTLAVRSAHNAEASAVSASPSTLAERRAAAATSHPYATPGFGPTLHTHHASDVRARSRAAADSHNSSTTISQEEALRASRMSGFASDTHEYREGRLAAARAAAVCDVLQLPPVCLSTAAMRVSQTRSAEGAGRSSIHRPRTTRQLEEVVAFEQRPPDSLEALALLARGGGSLAGWGGSQLGGGDGGGGEVSPISMSNPAATGAAGEGVDGGGAAGSSPGDAAPPSTRPATAAIAPSNARLTTTPPPGPLTASSPPPIDPSTLPLGGWYCPERVAEVGPLEFARRVVNRRAAAYDAAVNGRPSSSPSFGGGGRAHAPPPTATSPYPHGEGASPSVLPHLPHWSPPVTGDGADGRKSAAASERAGVMRSQGAYVFGGGRAGGGRGVANSSPAAASPSRCIAAPNPNPLLVHPDDGPFVRDAAMALHLKGLASVNGAPAAAASARPGVVAARRGVDINALPFATWYKSSMPA